MKWVNLIIGLFLVCNCLFLFVAGSLSITAAKYSHTTFNAWQYEAYANAFFVLGLVSLMFGVFMVLRELKN